MIVRVLGVVVVLLGTACGGGLGSAALALPGPAARGAEPILHPFFPLVPGERREHRGEHLGLARLELTRVAQQPVTVAGVRCLALHEDVFLDGVRVEASVEWFAADVEGNLWKFGELSFEVVDGLELPTADSWQAGTGGFGPWLWLPAQPLPGDELAGAHPDGTDRRTVVATDEPVSVPAGHFAACLMVLETEDDVEDPDIVLYAPNVGRVAVITPQGGTGLVR